LGTNFFASSSFSIAQKGSKEKSEKKKTTVKWFQHGVGGCELKKLTLAAPLSIGPENTS